MAEKSEKKREKAPKADARTSPMTKLYYILGAVAVVGIGVVGYGVGSSAMSSAVTEPVELDVESDRELVEMARGVVRGDPDAAVSIVEFGDYQCPGCGGFARQVKPMIDLNFIDSGRANFVFYDFPLIQIHSNAFLAARAARCAGDQDAYWEYHDQLFGNQRSWASAANPAGDFVSYAEEIGIDAGAFERCLKSDRHAETVTANLRLGEALGVSGTPTVMISEGQGMATRLSSFDFASIEQAVNEALENGDEGSGSDAP